MRPTLLVTGGAGFIGSCFVRRHLALARYRIINLDLLTYAGNLDSIPIPASRDPAESQHYVFVHGDIGDRELVDRMLASYRPQAIVNFAAESHVDRSIDDASAFVQTNVVGTSHLLDAARAYCQELSSREQSNFRFLQVSTDEVYGSLGADGKFTESTPYAPNSPYSASKAAADMFVRAYRETYGLPTLQTNCSNNYGPYQFPEKLIPLMTLNACEGKPLPVYGDGANIRDWLYVEDHCAALDCVLSHGRVGQTYNIGGDSEQTNLQVVQAICDLVNEMHVSPPLAFEERICFVADRPGHDRRYAIDSSKIRRELGWQPRVDFSAGLRVTVAWYLANSAWVQRVQSGQYRRERQGLGKQHDHD